MSYQLNMESFSENFEILILTPSLFDFLFLNVRSSIPESSKNMFISTKASSTGLDKLSRLINNEIDGIYGLGNKRTLKDYEFLSGINLRDRKIVDKEKAVTANFVSSLSWKDSPF